MITVVGLGCQSSTTPAPQAAASPQRAVIVSGGNAGNVTVFLPSDDPANPTMLCTSSGTTVCPECKSAAIKYFQTGVLDPKCSRTGATRTSVVGVPPTYGHN